MLQTLPGIAVTYQGEELGLLNTHLSWEETVDPSACNTQDPINYEKASRDGCRTPFPWDDSLNAGFSTAAKTWLPVNTDYTTMNVKAQEEATNSHLKIFKKIVKLRKNNVMRRGEYDARLINSDRVLIYRRYYDQDLVVVILNFHTEDENVNVESAFADVTLPSQLQVYTSSLDTFIDGTSYQLSDNLLVPANKAVVLTNISV
jgi:glycosidase